MLTAFRGLVGVAGAIIAVWGIGLAVKGPTDSPAGAIYGIAAGGIVVGVLLLAAVYGGPTRRD